MHGSGQTNDTPAAYRPREAAAKLSVGLSTLWKWVRTGDIPVRRIGRVTLIPADAIHDFLNAVK